MSLSNLSEIADRLHDNVPALRQDYKTRDLVPETISKGRRRIYDSGNSNNIRTLPNSSKDQSRPPAWIFASSLSTSGLNMIFVFITLSVSLFLYLSHASESDKLNPYSRPFNTRGSTEISSLILTPCDIDITAHEAVLHELGDLDVLQSIVFVHAQVASSANFTSQKLHSGFDRAIKTGTEIPIQLLNPDTIDEIKSVRQQVRFSMHNVSKLFDLYQSLRLAYYALHRTSTEAYEKAQPNEAKQFIISATPVLLRYIGLDAERAWWDPWMEKKKMVEEARLGIVALERESERLQQIKQTLYYLDHSLQQQSIAALKGSAQQGGRFFTWLY